MDLVKVWGNLLANYAIGTSVCAIPTTYFVQGTAQVQILATCTNNNDTDTNSSVETDINQVNEETPDGFDDLEQGEENEDDDELIYEPNDEGEPNDQAVCDNDNENKDEEEESGSKKEKRIKRVRYSREEYRCTLCPYTCTTEKAFLKHLRNCESKEANEVIATNDLPRLSCPICGKDRNGEQSLEAHMQKHRDDKLFCCDICKFKTLQLKKLIQHRRMHTGERPHLCPFCTYRSARRDNLRSHVRRVHKKANLPCDTFNPRSMLVTPSKNKT